MPLLTQHCWHLSEPLWPTDDWGAADSGYRGDGGRGASCAAETLPLTMRGSGCGRRRLRLDRVTQLPGLRRRCLWFGGRETWWGGWIGCDSLGVKKCWPSCDEAKWREMETSLLQPLETCWRLFCHQGVRCSSLFNEKTTFENEKKRKKRNGKCFIEQRHTSARMLTPGGQCCCYAGPQDKKPSFHISPEEGKTTTAVNKKRLRYVE